MLLPKWLVIVLFIVAIGSTGGLLFLLTQRTNSSPTPNAKLDAVMISATPLASSKSASSSAVASASASPLSATAEWKKYSNDSVSVKFEYPDKWYVSASDSAKIKITSYDPKTLSEDKLPKDAVQLTISRTKKPSSSQKLISYLDDRLKFYKDTTSSIAVKEENNRKIDTFDAVDRLYSATSVTQREIAFATKNYFYVIAISPSDTLLTAGVDELLKTIEII